MEQYNKLTDADLVTLLKSGDEKKFMDISNRYWTLLCGHAQRMLNGDEEAEDVIQETFVLFLNKINQLELKSNISGYLYANVRNQVFNHVERYKVKDRCLGSIKKFMDQGDFQAYYLIRDKQLAALIEEEIAALPELMHVTFELSRNANMSFKEIAEQLGVSEEVVRNNISRALSYIKGEVWTHCLNLSDFKW